MEKKPKSGAGGETCTDVDQCLGALSAAMRAAAADPAGLGAEFKSLYEEHSATLVRHATAFGGSAEAAQDAVQDSFIRYWQLRHSGVSITDPRAWLTAVAKNNLIDQRRREQRQLELDGPAAVEAAHLNPAPCSLDQIETAHLWERIEALVSPRELACLRMREEGYSYAEIAKELGVQIGTVSAFLTRSREKASHILQARIKK